jgi:hypothetical protein
MLTQALITHQKLLAMSRIKGCQWGSQVDITWCLAPLTPQGELSMSKPRGELVDKRVVMSSNGSYWREPRIWALAVADRYIALGDS